MSEVKDSMEDTGEAMKRGAKKAGKRIEEGAEETKDKIDQFVIFSISLFFHNYFYAWQTDNSKISNRRQKNYSRK